MAEEKVRAQFEWNTFWGVITVFIIDFVGVAIVVALIWCFVLCCVLDGKRISASPKDIADITQAIAWPSTVAILILLFRNPLVRILNEVPSFIKRSYYRHGGDVLNANGTSVKLGNEGGVTASKGKPQEGDEVDMVVGTLVRKFGGVCHFEKCIGNRAFIYDVVIEADDRIYGVEIKKSAGVDSWERVFARVKLMYSAYDESLRRRFVFVAVVIGEMSSDDELKLRRMGQEQDFVTQIIIQKFGRPI